MTCECCEAAREAPAHNLYTPACLWCGARLIQALGRLHDRPRSEIAARRRAVLTDWMAYGHEEAQLRALAKGPKAFAPERPASSSAPRATGRR